MLPLTVVPSLPAASLEEIKSLTYALRGSVRELQIDIVDGVYVPHTAWPFTEPEGMNVFTAMQSYTADFLLEIDCMIEKPEQYLEEITAVNPARICIHAGSTDNYEAIIAHAAAHGQRLGLAFTNDTPLDVFYEYRDEISYVQLMGITEVGQQGQPFDTRTLDRARELRVAFPELEIAVDGSVNAETIPLLYAAGVNRFAPGSAIAKQSDPLQAYKQLCALLQ